MHSRGRMPLNSPSLFHEISIARAAINKKIWDDLASRVDQSLHSFHHLTMPTLVLWGEKDRILDVSSIEVYDEYLPDSSIIIMKNRGHSPMTERPEEAAAL